jgi:hypothetical protein
MYIRSIMSLTADKDDEEESSSLDKRYYRFLFNWNSLRNSSISLFEDKLDYENQKQL